MEGNIRRSFFLSHRLIQGIPDNCRITITSCRSMACLSLSLPTEHSTNVTLCWTSEWPWSGSWWPWGNFFKLRQASMLVVRMKQDCLGPEWKHKAHQSTICIKVKMVKTLWRLWFHSASPTDQHWSTTARLTRPKCVAGWCWMMLDAADSGQGSFGQQKDRGLKF